MSHYYKEVIDILESLDGMYREILVDIAKSYPKAFCDSYHRVTGTPEGGLMPALKTINPALEEEEYHSEPKTHKVVGEGGLNINIKPGLMPPEITEAANQVTYSPNTANPKVAVSVLQLIYAKASTGSLSAGEANAISTIPVSEQFACTMAALRYCYAHELDSPLFDDWSIPNGITIPGKVSAIKKVREITKLGLKESKAFVDTLSKFVYIVADLWESQNAS